MNKQELIAKVAESTGASKACAKNAVEAAFAAITEAVAAGEKVQLIGFGTFEQKARAARTGKNPKTGAAIEIPASKVPAFKAGKAFKDAVK